VRFGGCSGGDAEPPKLNSDEKSSLSTWLKASNKKGLTVPWAYIRRQVARSWNVPPWAIDEAPYDEVLLELEILRLESEAEKRNG
jgi:hypothetical protein